MFQLEEKKLKQVTVYDLLGNERVTEKNYFSQIDLQQGKAKNLLEMTILGNGHFMKVFYKMATFPKQPLLSGL